jgi:hypothetical protein
MATSLNPKECFKYYPHDLAIRVVQGTRCPHIQRQFWTKRLKLVMVKTMRMKGPTPQLLHVQTSNIT